MLMMRLVQKTGSITYKMDSVLFDFCNCLTDKCKHIINIIKKIGLLFDKKNHYYYSASILKVDKTIVSYSVHIVVYSAKQLYPILYYLIL